MPRHTVVERKLFSSFGFWKPPLSNPISLHSFDGSPLITYKAVVFIRDFLLFVT